MLAIRMQRTGRKGYPTYRVIVQEAHRQPTSGRVVAQLGSYNPHTKVSTLDKEKAATFLKNGAQPSDRVVKLFQAEKVELPKWVKITSDKKQKAIKNAEKLRRNQPEQPEAPAAEAEESTPAPETPEQAETEIAAEPQEAQAPAETPPDSEDPTSVETAPETPEETK